MVSFQCCNPSCNNSLKPEGPILTMVTFKAKQFEMPISFTPSGAINLESLSKINSEIESKDHHVNFTLSTPQAINGSKGPFRVDHMEVILNTSALEKNSQSITICCSVCNRCCDYNT